jgi:O-antigen/teichoic acid export membrane protein
VTMRGTGTSIGALLARNTGYNLVGQAAPAVVALAALPMLTRLLGPERFGVLVILWLALTYLLDLGCGRATTKYVAELMAAGAYGRVRGVASMAIVLQSAIGVALGALLWIAAPAVAGDLLSVSSQYRGDAIAAFRWLAVAVPFITVSAAHRGVLEAAQRFDLVNAVRVPASVLGYLIPVAVGLGGGGLAAIGALLAASRIAAALAFAWLARRVVPESAGFVFAAAELRAVAVFAGWLTVSTVVSPVLVYGERFAVGALMTAEAVGQYAAAAEPVLRLLIVPASLIATLFPAFSALHGGGRRDRMASLSFRASKYLILGLSAVAVVLVPFAEPLLRWWLGEPFGAAAAALQLLGIGVVITALSYVPSTLVQAAGRPDLPAKFHLLELPIFILLLWLLIPPFGIAGAALAWVARGALDASLLHAAAMKLNMLDPASARRERLVPALTLSSLSLAAAWIVSHVGDLGLRAGGVAVLFTITATVGWRFALTDDDRTFVMRGGRHARAAEAGA